MPPRRSDLVLEPDQRAFVTGRTGSGKTWLATAWIARGGSPWAHGIAVDPKHALTTRELPGWQLVVGFNNALRLWGAEHPRLIVRPVQGDYARDAGYDALAVRLLMASRCGASAGWYDDEVLNAAPLGKIQLGLERLLTEGRGRCVPVVAATTRPIGVHNKLLSEATHLVMFNLNLPGDRAKLASFAGEELLDPRLLTERHTFAHYHADAGSLTLHDPIRL
jgi:hypothetical protein